MSRSIRWTATALILAFLTTGVVQAWPSAPARPALSAPEEPGLLAAAWEWLTSLFRQPEPKPAGQSPATSQQKGGCGADPNGLPLTCGS